MNKVKKLFFILSFLIFVAYYFYNKNNITKINEFKNNITKINEFKKNKKKEEDLEKQIELFSSYLKIKEFKKNKKKEEDLEKQIEVFSSYLKNKEKYEFMKEYKKSFNKFVETTKKRFEMGLCAITEVYESQSILDKYNSDIITFEYKLNFSKLKAKAINDVLFDKINSLDQKKYDDEFFDGILSDVTQPNESIIIKKYKELNELKKDESKLSLELIKRMSDIKSELDKLLIQFKLNKFKNKFLSLKKKCIDSASSNLESIKAGYEVGTRTSYDLLIAMISLNDREIEYIDTKYDILTLHFKFLFLKNKCKSIDEIFSFKQK